MGYKNPSHSPFHHPGDEGSCPSMPTETVNGKAFPNGDNPSMSHSGELPLKTDHIKHASGGADPTPAMPGA